MREAYYFQLTLRPHRKRSLSKTGRSILFLVAVPKAAAERSVSGAQDELTLRQAAERLARELAPLAMTGRRQRAGEDRMEISVTSIAEPAKDLLERAVDAERDGVRVWMLGANVD
jgi:hypothetical protein